MLVIAVQNTKGGATKSTTSTNLARAFQKLGHTVALGETDPQGSLREWYADNPASPNDQPKVIQLTSRELILAVHDNPELADTDLLIIDGVANGFREFVATAKVSDFVILVAQPTPADIKPMGELVDILADKEVPAAFLLTRTKKGDDLTELISGSLGEFPFPVLKNTIRDLKGFKMSFGAGQTVFEFSDYKPAQDDVNAVVNEVLELMQSMQEA